MEYWSDFHDLGSTFWYLKPRPCPGGEDALKLDWRFGTLDVEGKAKRRRGISHLDSFFYCRVRVRARVRLFVRSSIRVYKAYRTYYRRRRAERGSGRMGQ